MSDAKRLRRPSEGGYARGDETKLRIIEAAIELFGEQGYDRASTREIATRAGVNAPALQYYFENKEGLYRACAEYIAHFAGMQFEPVAEQAWKVLRSGAGTAALIDVFLGIQEVIADRIFTSPCIPSQRLFFAREQGGQEPSIASEILQQRLRKPLNDLSAALIARITGTEVDDPVTLIRMMSLHGQLLLFHVSKRNVLSLLDWKDIDAEKSELIRSTVRSQTRTLLELWSGLRTAPLLAESDTTAGKASPKAATKANAKANAKAGATTTRPRQP